MFELAVSFVSEPSHTAAPISFVDCQPDKVYSAAAEQSEELTTTSSMRQRRYTLKNRHGLGCCLAWFIYNYFLDQHRLVQ